MLNFGPFKRINAFQGLMIDAAVWRDAHDYHREQLRLHHRALHGFGVVQGLDVGVVGTDNTLFVQAGVALDQLGNYIVVPQPIARRLETTVSGLLYVVLRFVDEPEPPDNGSAQSARVVEGFTLTVETQPPSGAYVELARFQHEPAAGPIRAAADPDKPGPNELDVRGRQIASVTGGIISNGVAPVQQQPTVVETIQPLTTAGSPMVTPQPGRTPTKPLVELGIATHRAKGWDIHSRGVRNLGREIEWAAGFPTQVHESISPAEAERVDLLYIAGHGRLTLNESEVAGILRLLERGGVVVGDGCAHGPNGDNGALEFALAFNALSTRLGRQTLELVGRNHPLLEARHLFAEAPTGARNSSRVLEAAGMLYCDADYGCAWQGGSPDQALTRMEIRDALEFGVNMALYRRGQSDAH
jgi:hypothetical protein